MGSTLMHKNIIFDFGGVLIHWDPNLIYHGYFNCPEKTRQFYQETGIFELNKALDKGAIFTIELERLAQKFPHYREPIFLWRDRWPEMVHGAIPDTVAILEKLHAQNTPLYGLTNWSAETFPYALANFPFLRYFKDIVVSGQVNAIKPEPEIFQILLKRNHLMANECIFIDDVINNINAAETLGFATIHFQTPELLANTLKTFGFINN